MQTPQKKRKFSGSGYSRLRTPTRAQTPMRSASRYTYRRKGSFKSVTLSSKTGRSFPQEMRAKLYFIHQTNWAQTVPSQGINNYTFNLNSPFQPLDVSAVPRAQNFNIFANIYQRYYVTGATVEVNVQPVFSKQQINQTSTYTLTDNCMSYTVNLAVGDQETQLAPTSLDNFNKYNLPGALQYCTKYKPYYWRKYLSMNSLNLVKDPSLSHSQVNANPPDLTQMVVSVRQTDTSVLQSNMVLMLGVKIVYHTVFFDRKNNTELSENFEAIADNVNLQAFPQVEVEEPSDIPKSVRKVSKMISK